MVFIFEIFIRLRIMIHRVRELSWWY